MREHDDLTPTPGQTVGPFFGYALPWPGGEDLVPAGHPGAIRLHGTVYDGAGDPVPDALVEIWQADEDGTIAHAEGSLVRDGQAFTGFGRAAVDEAGHYSFTTVAPGPVAGRTPFIAMTVFARGLLNRLFTRVYLPVEDEVADAFLDSLSEHRRSTLLARPDDDGFVFDIHLQGEHETVFLHHDGAR